MFLAILYFAEILYQALCFKATTKNYDNLPKKRRTFTFEDKWPVFFESYEKRDGGERARAEKNIALRAACLITPGDFMIPGTICKDVSA